MFSFISVCLFVYLFVIIEIITYDSVTEHYRNKAVIKYDVYIQLVAKHQCIYYHLTSLPEPCLDLI